MIDSPAPSYSVTISRNEAKETAQVLQHCEEKDKFTDELERVKFTANYPEIETVDDYTIVTVIADIVPETDLTVGDLYRCSSREELFGLVFNEYLSSVRLRKLFQKMDADRSVQQFEVPTSDPTPTFADESGAIEPESLEYETKTAPRERQLGSVAVGSPRRSIKSIEDVCNELGSLISETAEEKLCSDEDGDRTEPERYDEPIYDTMYEVQNEGFRPDIAIVGEDVLEGEVAERFEYIPEITVFEDQWIGANEIFMADSDRVGYEICWSEPEIEISAPVEMGATDFPLIPIRVDFKQSKNWMVTEDRAFARTVV